MIYRKTYFMASLAGPIKRKDGRCTIHRGGALGNKISMFNTFSKKWEKIPLEEIPQEVLETFSEQDKNRIERAIRSIYSPLKSY